MKNKIIIILILAVAINMFGCGSKTSADNRPSDEELEKFSKVCGVVKDISKDIIKIQLCGSSFEIYDGKCFLEINNSYNSIKTDDDVLIYYSGDMKYEEKDSYIEASNVDVRYMEKYDNDGKFTANIMVSVTFTDENGIVYPKEDPRSGHCLFIRPLEEEPELNFSVMMYTNKDNNIEIICKDESISVSEKVTVTYDTKTMEILSITE